jgi:hypothetical protein
MFVATQQQWMPAVIAVVQSVHAPLVVAKMMPVRVTEVHVPLVQIAAAVRVFARRQPARLRAPPVEPLQMVVEELLIAEERPMVLIVAVPYTKIMSAVAINAFAHLSLQKQVTTIVLQYVGLFSLVGRLLAFIAVMVVVMVGVTRLLDLILWHVSTLLANVFAASKSRDRHEF